MRYKDKREILEEVGKIKFKYRSSLVGPDVRGLLIGPEHKLIVNTGWWSSREGAVLSLYDRLYEKLWEKTNDIFREEKHTG